MRAAIRVELAIEAENEENWFTSLAHYFSTGAVLITGYGQDEHTSLGFWKISWEA